MKLEHGGNLSYFQEQEPQIGNNPNNPERNLMKIKNLREWPNPPDQHSENHSI